MVNYIELTVKAYKNIQKPKKKYSEQVGILKFSETSRIHFQLFL